MWLSFRKSCGLAGAGTGAGTGAGAGAGDLWGTQEAIFFAKHQLIALALCMVTTVCVTGLWKGRSSLLPAHHPSA